MHPDTFEIVNGVQWAYRQFNITALFCLLVLSPVMYGIWFFFFFFFFLKAKSELELGIATPVLA